MNNTYDTYKRRRFRMRVFVFVFFASFPVLWLRTDDLECTSWPIKQNTHSAEPCIATVSIWDCWRVSTLTSDAVIICTCTIPTLHLSECVPGLTAQDGTCVVAQIVRVKISKNARISSYAFREEEVTHNTDTWSEFDNDDDGNRTQPLPPPPHRQEYGETISS